MYTFPALPKPSYSYDKGEEFNTLANTYASGYESRAKLMRFPKHSFSCVYNNVPLTDRDILHDFFRKVFGSGDSFWYVDFQSRKWSDEFVGRGVVLPLLGAVADDGGVQTDETIAANNTVANDMTLLPAVPVVNDAYYFISSVFPDVIRINIGIAGVGTWTIVWEYWKGSWGAVANLTDGTSGFKTAGTNDVKFDKPTDAVVTTIKGITGYAVRARVSAYTSVTTQPKGTQAWVGTRYYDLHGVATSAQSILIDGVVKTGGGTDYTFISGGGEAGADRIKMVSAVALGSLITSDFTGFLRIKGRLDKDAFQESIGTFNSSGIPMFNCKFDIKEVQW
jgi:hypothetical protein